MNEDRQKQILILSAFVAAAIMVIAIYIIFFTGESNPTTTTVSSPTGQTSSGFQLDVLQRGGYKALDQRPVQDGTLPVKPPASAGKANPFL